MHHLLIILPQICDTILKQIDSFVKRSTRMFPCNVICLIITIFLLRMNPIKTFLFQKSNLSWSLGMHSRRRLTMGRKRWISYTLDKILISEKRLMQYFIFSIFHFWKSNNLILILYLNINLTFCIFLYTNIFLSFLKWEEYSCWQERVMHQGIDELYELTMELEDYLREFNGRLRRKKN